MVISSSPRIPDKSVRNAPTSRLIGSRQVFLLPLLHPTHHAKQQWAAHTVKFHVNRILNKLDVSDAYGNVKDERTQAVIVAVKRGIVSL